VVMGQVDAPTLYESWNRNHDGRSPLGHLETLRAGLSAHYNLTDFGAAGLFECIIARIDNGTVRLVVVGRASTAGSDAFFTIVGMPS
jgi:hypothetical protein